MRVLLCSTFKKDLPGFAKLLTSSLGFSDVSGYDNTSPEESVEGETENFVGNPKTCNLIHLAG